MHIQVKVFNSPNQNILAEKMNTFLRGLEPNEVIYVKVDTVSETPGMSERIRPLYVGTITYTTKN